MAIARRAVQPTVPRVVADLAATATALLIHPTRLTPHREIAAVAQVALAALAVGQDPVGRAPVRPWHTRPPKCGR